MNMNDELLEEWELSKEKPTKRFKELLGIIAKNRFDKYTKFSDIQFEYWVKDYIIQGVIKNRDKFRPSTNTEITGYFTTIADGYAANICDKLIKGELKSSES